MTKIIKILFVITVIPAAVILFLYMGWSFGPGSHPRAEVYKINISEDSLLIIIDEFKNENPEFNIDEVAVLDRKHKDWNYRYFFYPDKKIKIMTYVRSGLTKSDPTSFAFIKSSPGWLASEKWTDANESFWWWKNKSQKEEFERLILNPIKEKIDN
jgi:hypothetical protein